MPGCVPGKRAMIFKGDGNVRSDGRTNIGIILTVVREYAGNPDTGIPGKHWVFELANRDINLLALLGHTHPITGQKIPLKYIEITGTATDEFRSKYGLMIVYPDSYLMPLPDEDENHDEEGKDLFMPAPTQILETME